MKKVLAGFFMVLLLVAFLIGCSSGDADVSAPVTALGYVILAETGISTGPGSAVTGNMGVSAIAATAITGFDLVADASNEFSTSALVTGRIYASDYATPTPANLTAAVDDMETMYTALAGMSPGGNVDLYGGDLIGQSPPPGVYRWTGALALSAAGTVTLTGSASDVWVFQVGGALNTSASSIVALNGAQPQNVKWVVTGGANLGASSVFKGVILSQTAITLGAGAEVDGRLLAQTAVTLDASTVTQP